MKEIETKLFSLQEKQKSFSFLKRLIGCYKEIQFDGVENLAKIAEITDVIDEKIFGDYDQLIFENSQRNNIKNVVLGDLIATNTNNKKFEVSVYKATCESIDLAVKVYNAKQSLQDLNEVLKEAEILNKLSELANVNNCFTKFYGV